jgi:hypothetical protein
MAAQRQIITLALLENRKRSNTAISKVVGCTDMTVAAVRMALEDDGRIEKWIPHRSWLNPNRAGLVVAKLIAENPDVSQAEIARMAGCRDSIVSVVKHSRRINSALRNSEVPINSRQALIDNPMLNHTTVAQKIGVAPNRVKTCCDRLVAEGVYDRCGHHQKQDGTPVAPAGARMSDIYVTRIAELEAEKARLRKRIAELEGDQ